MTQSCSETLDGPEAKPEPKLAASRDPVTWLRLLPLAVVLGGLALADIAILTFLEVKSEETAGLVIGVMFAQIAISAVWTSLGPPRFFPRLVTGISVVALACLTMYVCAMRDSGSDEIGPVLTGAMMLQWLMYQIPLAGSRLQGWQMGWPGAPHGSAAGASQFGILQVMIWTAVASVFFAVGRVLLGSSTIDSDLFDQENVALFLALSVSNTLLVFPFIWGSLVRQSGWGWIWWVIALGWAGLVTAVESFLLDQVLGIRGDQEMFMLLNLAQVIAVTIALITFRIGGFRLVRTTRPV